LQNLVHAKEQQLEAGSLRSRLQEMEEVKVAWQRFLARIKWKQKKNIFKKYKFPFIRPKPSKALIFDLNDEDANGFHEGRF
jgi:hypothetical protein